MTEIREDSPAVDDPTPLPSAVVITFPGPGMSGCAIRGENVNVGQLFEAAGQLDAFARDVRAANLAQQAAAAAQVAAMAAGVKNGRLGPMGRPRG